MVKSEDIVQITNEAHRWYPCLIIVTEVHEWGIEGYITIPNNGMESNSDAFTRLNNGEFETVGNALIVRASEEED